MAESGSADCSCVTSASTNEDARSPDASSDEPFKDVTAACHLLRWDSNSSAFGVLP